MRSHPDATVYHHPAWLEVLESEYPQQSAHLACESASGELQAILPMLYTRGLPLGLGGPNAARRLSSLPRTPLAGPLSTSREASVAILQNALGKIHPAPEIQLQIKTQGPALDGLTEDLVGRPWRLSYVLTLPDRLKGPYRITDSHERARIRWAINKAQKQGVRIRQAESERDLQDWYSLYLKTMRRNVVPPRSMRFFAGLWRHLESRGMMRLLIAELNTEGQKRIIAGSIFLLYGRTVFYAFNGSSQRDFSLRPNDAILWDAIHSTCDEGFRFFDFGEVPEGNFELAKFKTKWGSDPVRLYRYYSSARSERNSPRKKTEGGDSSRASLQHLTDSIWRRLPLRTTEWMGDRFYSYL